MTAGEDWVRLFRQGSGLVCMFHRKIGVAFARLSEADIFLKKELSRLYPGCFINKKEFLSEKERRCFAGNGKA